MALRVVLDTNVIISGLMRGSGPPVMISRLWREGMLEVCTSPPLIAELRGVISRPHILRLVKMPPRKLTDWLEALPNQAIVIPVNRLRVLAVVPEDPSDDLVLATAVAAGAHAIVSGDRHLRTLRTHAGIPVLSPRELIERLGP